MNKKEFPVKGHCLSTNPIIVKYLKDNFEKIVGNMYSKKSTGVAWNEKRWWYITNNSRTPEYDPLVIMTMITEINEMNKINEMNNSLIVTGTLATSDTITASNYTGTTITTTTTTPIYNPNNSLESAAWIYEVGTGTSIAKSLVTEPIKLRIICRNLKKSLKVSLLQINLK